MKARTVKNLEAGKPLEVVEFDLDGPHAGEVSVEVKATGVCHADVFISSDDHQFSSL